MESVETVVKSVPDYYPLISIEVDKSAVPNNVENVPITEVEVMESVMKCCGEDAQTSREEEKIAAKTSSEEAMMNMESVAKSGDENANAEVEREDFTIADCVENIGTHLVVDKNTATSVDENTETVIEKQILAVKSVVKNTRTCMEEEISAVERGLENTRASLDKDMATDESFVKHTATIINEEMATVEDGVENAKTFKYGEKAAAESGEETTNFKGKETTVRHSVENLNINLTVEETEAKCNVESSENPVSINSENSGIETTDLNVTMANGNNEIIETQKRQQETETENKQSMQELKKMKMCKVELCRDYLADCLRKRKDDLDDEENEIEITGFTGPPHMEKHSATNEETRIRLREMLDKRQPNESETLKKLCKDTAGMGIKPLCINVQCLKMPVSGVLFLERKSKMPHNSNVKMKSKDLREIRPKCTCKTSHTTLAEPDKSYLTSMNVTSQNLPLLSTGFTYDLYELFKRTKLYKPKANKRIMNVRPNPCGHIFSLYCKDQCKLGESIYNGFLHRKNCRTADTFKSFQHFYHECLSLVTFQLDSPAKNSGSQSDCVLDTHLGVTQVVKVLTESPLQDECQSHNSDTGDIGKTAICMDPSTDKPSGQDAHTNTTTEAQPEPGINSNVQHSSETIKIGNGKENEGEIGKENEEIEKEIEGEIVKENEEVEEENEGEIGKENEGGIGEENEGEIGKEIGEIGKKNEGKIGKENEGEIGKGNEGKIGKENEGEIGKENEGEIGKKNEGEIVEKIIVNEDNIQPVVEQEPQNITSIFAESNTYGEEHYLNPQTGEIEYTCSSSFEDAHELKSKKRNYVHLAKESTELFADMKKDVEKAMKLAIELKVCEKSKRCTIFHNECGSAEHLTVEYLTSKGIHKMRHIIMYDVENTILSMLERTKRLSEVVGETCIVNIEAGIVTATEHLLKKLTSLLYDDQNETGDEVSSEQVESWKVVTNFIQQVSDKIVNKYGINWARATDEHILYQMALKEAFKQARINEAENSIALEKLRQDYEIARQRFEAASKFTIAKQQLLDKPAPAASGYTAVKSAREAVENRLKPYESLIKMKEGINKNLEKNLFQEQKRNHQPKHSNQMTLIHREEDRLRNANRIEQKISCWSKKMRQILSCDCACPASTNKGPVKVLCAKHRILRQCKSDEKLSQADLTIQNLQEELSKNIDGENIEYHNRVLKHIEDTGTIPVLVNSPETKQTQTIFEDQKGQFENNNTTVIKTEPADEFNQEATAPVVRVTHDKPSVNTEQSAKFLSDISRQKVVFHSNADSSEYVIIPATLAYIPHMPQTSSVKTSMSGMTEAVTNTKESSKSKRLPGILSRGKKRPQSNSVAQTVKQSINLLRARDMMALHGARLQPSNTDLPSEKLPGLPIGADKPIVVGPFVPFCPSTIAAQASMVGPLPQTCQIANNETTSQNITVKKEPQDHHPSVDMPTPVQVKVPTPDNQLHVSISNTPLGAGRQLTVSQLLSVSGNQLSASQLPSVGGSQLSAPHIPLVAGSQLSTSQSPLVVGNQLSASQFPLVAGSQLTPSQIPLVTGHQLSTSQFPFVLQNQQTTSLIPLDLGNQGSTLQVPMAFGNQQQVLQVPFAFGNNQSTSNITFASGNQLLTPKVPLVSGNQVLESQLQLGATTSATGPKYILIKQQQPIQSRNQTTLLVPTDNNTCNANQYILVPETQLNCQGNAGFQAGQSTTELQPQNRTPQTVTNSATHVQGIVHQKKCEESLQPKILNVFSVKDFGEEHEKMDTFHQNKDVKISETSFLKGTRQEVVGTNLCQDEDACIVTMIDMRDALHVFGQNAKGRDSISFGFLYLSSMHLKSDDYRCKRNSDGSISVFLIRAMVIDALKIVPVAITVDAIDHVCSELEKLSIFKPKMITILNIIETLTYVSTLIKKLYCPTLIMTPVHDSCSSSVICQICSMEFESEKLFEKHADTHRKGLEFKRKMAEQEQVFDYGNPSFCIFCQKCFSTGKSFRSHFKWACSKGKKKSGDTSLESDVNLGTNESEIIDVRHMFVTYPYLLYRSECHVCFAFFNSEKRFKKHISMHVVKKEASLRCFNCQILFEYDFDRFDEHCEIHRIGDSGSPFSCTVKNICSATFWFVLSLDIHYQRCHKVPIPIGLPGKHKEQLDLTIKDAPISEEMKIGLQAMIKRKHDLERELMRRKYGVVESKENIRMISTDNSEGKDVRSEIEMRKMELLKKKQRLLLELQKRKEEENLARDLKLESPTVSNNDDMNVLGYRVEVNPEFTDDESTGDAEENDCYNETNDTSSTEDGEENTAEKNIKSVPKDFSKALPLETFGDMLQRPVNVSKEKTADPVQKPQGSLFKVITDPSYLSQIGSFDEVMNSMRKKRPREPDAGDLKTSDGGKKCKVPKVDSVYSATEVVKNPWLYKELTGVCVKLNRC